MKLSTLIIASAAVLFVVVFTLDRRAEKEYVGDRIRVSYWEKWTGMEGEAITETVRAFNAKELGGVADARRKPIMVDLLTQSRVDEKFKLAASGGNPPDIAGVWSANICVFAEMGVILPLDDLLKQANIKREDYLPAYWNPSVYDGKVWALPTTPATIALHWNKGLFRESADALRAAGLDPNRAPRSIEEIDRYSDILTKRDADGNITRLGFSPRAMGWWNWAWGLWWGGRLWDGKSKITIASDENIAAYEWVQSYSRRYGRNQMISFQDGFGNLHSPQNAFCSEKVAMVLQGVWMHNFIEKYNPKIEWGAVPFPAKKAGLKNVTVAEYDCVVLPSEATNTGEAFAFLKFLATPEGMEILCRGQKKHSPLATITDDFRDRHPHPYIHVFQDLARSPNAHHAPQLGIWQAYSREMNWAMDEIWLKEVTVREVLEKVQRKMQRMLDRELAERAARRTRRGQESDTP